MTNTHTASLEGDALRPQRPVAARLRVLFPPELVGDVAIGAEPVTLGRQPDDDSPPIAHATVSRRHAQVWWDGAGHHVVRDLGSRHGTRHGGREVDATPQPLEDGDVLRLGDVFAAYEVAGDDDRGQVDRALVPGQSAAVAALRAQVARAAGDPSPALVIGDTGTGKEWVAQALHRLSGRSGPLVAVNCATLSRELAESQLFGHSRGAFTGAVGDHDGWFRQAAGGTLVLDEMGELPIDLQPKLLRVLQDGQVHPVGASRPVAVDVRVVASTNRDLAAAVEAGQFRRDLLARLAKWTVRVPALASRRGDVLEWIARLWAAWHAERARAAPSLQWTAEAVAVVLTATWPANLRDVDRLVHELAGARLDGVGVGDLPAWLRDLVVDAADRPAGADEVALAGPPVRLPVPTRDEFVAVWTTLGGSVRAVAKHFGRDRRQIYRWAATHGLRTEPDGE